MTRLGIVIVTTVLLLAACTGEEEPGENAANVESTEGTEDRVPDSAAQQTLDEGGLLENGAVAFGPTTPDEEFHPAVCDYVFGTAEQVGEAAGLTGDVALGEGGPLQLGGNGSGVRCTYTVDGVDALMVQLWSQEMDVAPEEEDVVTVQLPVQTAGSEHFALAAVHPEYDGPLTLDEAAATALLEDAGTRWSGGSV